MSDEGNQPPDSLQHEIFVGHSEVEAGVRADLLSERMHHAWLISGARGIGKATLAARIARFLLKTAADKKNVPAGATLAIGEDDKVFRQLAALSHPDFLLLRARAPESGRGQAIIPVEEARRAGDFFSRHAALGGYRVCIVDAADEMNVNAANAFLKLVEEPPAHCLLLLVAHRPMLVPATLRSRCRSVKMNLLSDAAVAEVFTQHFPDMAEEERAMLVAMARGAPGRAMQFFTPENLAFYRALEEFFARTAREGVNSAAIHELSETAGSSEAHWRIFLDGLSFHIAAAGRRAADANAQADAIDCLLRLWYKISQISEETARFNMNRSHAALAILMALQEEVSGGASVQSFL